MTHSKRRFVKKLLRCLQRQRADVIAPCAADERVPDAARLAAAVAAEELVILEEETVSGTVNAFM